MRRSVLFSSTGINEWVDGDVIGDISFLVGARIVEIERESKDELLLVVEVDND